MSTDMKLGLVAGVLAVAGVALFGMPKTDPPKPAPTVVVPATPTPPASVPK